MSCHVNYQLPPSVKSILDDPEKRSFVWTNSSLLGTLANSSVLPCASLDSRLYLWVSGDHLVLRNSAFRKTFSTPRIIRIFASPTPAEPTWLHRDLDARQRNAPVAPQNQPIGSVSVSCICFLFANSHPIHPCRQPTLQFTNVTGPSPPPLLLTSGHGDE